MTFMRRRRKKEKEVQKEGDKKLEKEERGKRLHPGKNQPR